MPSASFDVVKDAIAPFWPAFHEDRTQVPGTVRAVMLAWIYDGVVGNGGHQGWIESAGDMAAETVEALRLLGAEDHASIAATALDMFPNAASPSVDDRIAVVDTWPDEGPQIRALWKLDEAAFDLDRRDPLIDRYAASFVRDHAEDFAR